MNSDRFFGHSEGAGGRNQRKPLFKRILVAGISSAMTLGLLVGGVTVSPAWGEEMNSASAPSSVSASTTAETLGGVLDSADLNSIENGESDGAGTPQPQEPEITVPETPTDPQPETPSTGTDPAPEGEGSEDIDVEIPQTDIEKEAVPQADEPEESENIDEQEEEDIEELATGAGYNWTTESNYRSVTVQATGERSNTGAAVTPLNGAVYVAVRSNTTTPPLKPGSLNDSYFYCTTGLQQGTLPREDGKCVIRIPDASTNNANNDNNQYWIVEYSAPAPYEILTSITTGGIRNNNDLTSTAYAFRIAGRNNNSRNFTVPYADGATQIADKSSSTASNSEKNRVTSGWWPHVRTNPQFPKQCLGSAPMRIALVLDTSGSMDGSMGDLRDAAKAFVDTDALGLTNTNISLYSFADTASQLLDSTSLSTQEGIDTVTSKIDELTKASGGTNWDHALRIIPNGQWDAVIMLTDGNPTYRRNNANSSTNGDGNTTSLHNVENAIVAANRLKNLGTAVWAVGIGMPANSRANLDAIAHPDNVYLTVSSQLKETLKGIATQAQCQASVTVNKVVEENGVTSPATGWDMTTALTDKVAGALGPPELWVKTNNTWGATADSSTQATSGSEGSSEWRIQFKNPTGSTTTVNVNETDKAGYVYDSVVVKKNSQTISSGKSVQLTGIKPGDVIEVTYKNRKVVPVDGLVSWQKLDDADGSLLGGSTWQIKNATGTQVIKTVEDNSIEDLDKTDGQFQVRLNLGTYTIVESVAPEGYDLITTSIPSFDLTVNNAEQGIVIGPFRNIRKTGSVTWKKINPSEELLAGSVWTITPINPTGAAFDVADNTGQTGYSGRDTDARPGWFKVEGLSWGDYSVMEKTAPENYDPDTTVHPFTISKTALNYGFDIGFVNNPIKGTVVWSKVGENDDPLSDTEWTITPVNPAGTVLTITDCTSASCAGEDKNPAVGQFQVINLPVGTYRLEETKTKDGYILDTTVREFSITADSRNYVFEGSFVNKRPIIPDLPLTGGVGADGYWIGGAIALVLTAVTVAGTQIKRRRDAHASL